MSDREDPPEDVQEDMQEETLEDQVFGADDDDDDALFGGPVTRDEPEEPEPEEPEPVVEVAIKSEPEPEAEEPAAAARVATPPTPVAREPAPSAAGPADPEPSAPKAAYAVAAVEDDGLHLTVNVTEPHKIGSGMSSYMAYKITMQTDMPAFPVPESTQDKRFSDFLALQLLLVENYPGIIIPRCPPKDAMGTGFMKFKSAGNEITPFIEQRCAALERFMQRIASHPLLKNDEDVRRFLTTNEKVPKAKTNAISNLISKMGTHVEIDTWFEDKGREVDTLNSQLNKLHTVAEGLVSERRDLAASTETFATSFAALAQAEEVPALQQAMYQLADVEQQVAKLHNKQANSDFYDFCEILEDWLWLVQATRAVFVQRQATYKNWQNAESTLVKKKESKAKLEMQGKVEKLDQASREITEAEALVVSSKKTFVEISLTIKDELKRFDKLKVMEFQAAAVCYIERAMTAQHQICKHFEQLLPELKAVVVA